MSEFSELKAKKSRGDKLTVLEEKSYRQSVHEQNARTIRLYLPSIDERNEIKAAAKQSGLTMSDYLLGHYHSSLRAPEADSQLVAELRVLLAAERSEKLQVIHLTETILSDHRERYRDQQEIRADLNRVLGIVDGFAKQLNNDLVRGLLIDDMKRNFPAAGDDSEEE